MRSWQKVAALAVVALGVQFYGLYRLMGPPTPPRFPNADKLEHLLGFGLPVFLILVTLNLRRRARGRAGLSGLAIAVVAAIFVAHAALSEIIQHTLYVTRSGDPRDAVADTIGVTLGVIGYLLVMRAYDRNRTRA